MLLIRYGSLKVSSINPFLTVLMTGREWSWLKNYCLESGNVLSSWHGSSGVRQREENSTLFFHLSLDQPRMEMPGRGRKPVKYIHVGETTTSTTSYSGGARMRAITVSAGIH